MRESNSIFNVSGQGRTTLHRTVLTLDIVLQRGTCDEELGARREGTEGLIKLAFGVLQSVSLSSRYPVSYQCGENSTLSAPNETHLVNS